MNVTDDVMEAAVKETGNAFGRFDILIHSASKNAHWMNTKSTNGVR